MEYWNPGVRYEKSKGVNMGDTLNTEVAVIGSGVSGLAAALTSAEGGAKVTVFEKQRSLGGTSNFFNGIFATESDMQRARFITYRRDEAFKNIMEYSHWRANPRLVRAIVNESAATITWLQREGVEFIDAINNLLDAPRTYHVVKGGGEAVVKALVMRNKEKEVNIVLATPVNKILRTGDSVDGILVEENGEETRVNAGVVIIASGGYANNKEWIKKYAGFDLDVNILPVGNVDKTGDGIRMAWEVGADKEGLGVLELFRVGPTGPEFAMKSPIEYAVVQPDLWVDDRGERFCDESIGFYETSVGNASARQKGGDTYSIFDSSTVRRLMEDGIDKSHGLDFPPGSRVLELARDLARALENNSGEVFQAGSIRELADKIKVDPARLQATVDEYNGFCEKGHDDLFAKPPKYLRPIEGPNFYAVRARTIFLGTLGGIKINEKTEVMDKKEKAIPGLYAVGFDAGGMYGDSYCIRDASGLSSGFAINSGRIAGRNALKYLGK
jgi:fumarate reductase flavoprotein subunit